MPILSASLENLVQQVHAMDRKMQILATSFEFLFSGSFTAVDRKMQILSTRFEVLFQQVFNCYG